MSVRRALAALALGLVAVLVALPVFAQQPPVPPAGQNAHRVDPSQLPPNLQERLRQMQQQRGGQPPRGPGKSPFGAHPTPPPRAHVAPAEEEEVAEAHAVGHHECPGHGPMEPPPPVNWWRGLLVVNNDLATSDNRLYQLLFRFHNPKDECDPRNVPPPFLASVVNFGVLAFVLYRFGKKPLEESLAKRKHTIMADIDTAAELKAQAAARLGEYKRKFAKLDDTLKALRDDLSTQAEQERKHILTEAAERRIRMQRDAEFRIDQDLKTARAELVQDSVVAAVAAAAELIAGRVGAADQDRIADDFMRSVATSFAPASKATETAASRGAN